MLMIYSIVSFLFMIAPSLLSNILYHGTGLYAYTGLCRHRPLLVMGCYIMVPVICLLPLSFLMDGGQLCYLLSLHLFLFSFLRLAKNQNWAGQKKDDKEVKNRWETGIHLNIMRYFTSDREIVADAFALLSCPTPETGKSRFSPSPAFSVLFSEWHLSYIQT